MKLPRIGFTVKVLASILAGVLVGVFFGEMTAILDPVGQIFIKLMQITVIPTVIIFIITGIGTISEADARDFLRKVAGVILLIWGLGVLVFFAMQYAFPPVQSSSFFSTTLASGAEETDLVSLFIPSNIFASLAEGLMPAIVLFCLLLGWALIGDARNRPFVDLLKSLNSALSKITNLLMAIVPVGVFAITAATFGTLTWPQLLQIQVYYVSAVVLCLVMALLILPLLIYSLTPWTYREILSASHRGVLMGFATARVFITLPLLSEGVASLFRSPTAGGGEPAPAAEIAPSGDGAEPAGEPALSVEERAAAYGGILVPLAYSIPSLGVFVVLLFVLFAAWYYNDLFTLQEQVFLALVGVPSLFGSTKVSLPFILQMMRLPADAMQLYLIASPLQIYFTSALTCMSIFALSAICTAFLTGLGKLRVKRAMYSTVVAVVVFFAVVLALNAAFGAVLATTSQGHPTVLSMKMPPDAGGARVGDGFETAVYRNSSDVPPVVEAGDAARNATLLDRIRERDALRVGYVPDLMPFAYFNSDGELVGHDVQMAYDLAKVLNVSRVEFVPVDRAGVLDRVNNGRLRHRHGRPRAGPGHGGEGPVHLAVHRPPPGPRRPGRPEERLRGPGRGGADGGPEDRRRRRRRLRTVRERDLSTGDHRPPRRPRAVLQPERRRGPPDHGRARDLPGAAPSLLRRRGPAAVRRPFDLVRLRPRQGLRRRLPDVHRGTGSRWRRSTDR